MLIMHCAEMLQKYTRQRESRTTYHQVHLTNRLQGKPDVHAGTRRNNVP